MRKLIIAAALALGFAALVRAQPYDCGERTIAALANAVQRVAPIFMRQHRPPETTGAAPSQSREEWKRSLIEQGRAFCARYPDDAVCGGQR